MPYACSRSTASATPPCCRRRCCCVTSPVPTASRCCSAAPRGTATADLTGASRDDHRHPPHRRRRGQERAPAVLELAAARDGGADAIERGLLRIALDSRRLLPAAARGAAARTGAGAPASSPEPLGATTAIFAAITTRVQSDVKSSLAYAALTQVGIIVVEIAIGWYTLAFRAPGRARVLPAAAVPDGAQRPARSARDGDAGARRHPDSDRIRQRAVPDRARTRVPRQPSRPSGRGSVYAAGAVLHAFRSVAVRCRDAGCGGRLPSREATIAMSDARALACRPGGAAIARHRRVVSSSGRRAPPAAGGRLGAAHAGGGARHRCFARAAGVRDPHDRAHLGARRRGDRSRQHASRPCSCRSRRVCGS